MRAALVAMLIGASACASTDYAAAVKHRAAADLGCSEDRLTVVGSDRAWFVRGCEKGATYALPEEPPPRCTAIVAASEPAPPVAARAARP